MQFWGLDSLCHGKKMKYVHTSMNFFLIFGSTDYFYFSGLVKLDKNGDFCSTMSLIEQPHNVIVINLVERPVFLTPLDQKEI